VYEARVGFGEYAVKASTSAARMSRIFIPLVVALAMQLLFYILNEGGQCQCSTGLRFRLKPCADIEVLLSDSCVA
jgi:hypothetical protein